MKSKLEKARSAFLAGQREEALALLAQLTRKNRISGEMRLELAKMWRALGMPEKALKTLGPLIVINETSDYLALEIETAINQAHMVKGLGCKFLALRLSQGIAAYLSKHPELQINEEMLAFHGKYAHLLLELGRLDEALAMTEVFHDLIQKHQCRPATLMLYHEVTSRTHYYFGRHERAYTELGHYLKNAGPDNLSAQVIYHNRMATYLISQQKFRESLPHLQFVEKVIGQNPKAFVGETIHWYRLMAEWHYWDKNMELAKSFFDTMLARCKSLNYSAEIAIAGLFEYQKISADCLTLGQHIALRCHPNSNYYSYMAGRNISDVEKKNLPFWCHEELPASSQDNCWQVANGTIAPAVYDHLRKDIVESIERGQDILDLQSGILSHEGRVHLLSEIQHKTLMAIVGASEYGVDKWSLMEFVYRQSFMDINVGLARQSKIIASLRSLGLDIQLQDNYFRISLPAQTRIIFPMNYHSLGLWHLLREDDGSINRQILKETLAVKPETSKRWITEWRKKGLAA